MTSPVPNAPLPVVCDRCRAQGRTGEDPFEQFGALLDFEPVPRSSERADGWSPEVQRTYIAALSLTGNDRAACRAVGKSAFGVKQLLDHEGSAGFRAAREQALEMAADERGRRLAEGLRAAASEQAGWTPPEGPWAHAATRRGPRPAPSPADRPDEPDEDGMEARRLWLFGILEKYWLKIGQEREARLAGRVVAADFYLRQMTWLEVALDTVSEDAFKLMCEVREGGHRMVDLAETDFSRLLGRMRRQRWAELGEPSRPEHPPRRYLQDHGRYSTEPNERFGGGGGARSHEEQRASLEQRHLEDARAQLEWEGRSIAEAAERRASNPQWSEAENSSPSSPGEGGQPQAGGGAGKAGGEAAEPGDEQ